METHGLFNPLFNKIKDFVLLKPFSEWKDVTAFDRDIYWRFEPTKILKITPNEERGRIYSVNVNCISINVGFIDSTTISLSETGNVCFVMRKGSFEELVDGYWVPYEFDDIDQHRFLVSLHSFAALMQKYLD